MKEQLRSGELGDRLDEFNTERSRSDEFNFAPGDRDIYGIYYGIYYRSIIHWWQRSATQGNGENYKNFPRSNIK